MAKEKEIFFKALTIGRYTGKQKPSSISDERFNQSKISGDKSDST